MATFFMVVRAVPVPKPGIGSFFPFTSWLDGSSSLAPSSTTAPTIFATIDAERSKKTHTHSLARTHFAWLLISNGAKMSETHKHISNANIWLKLVHLINVRSKHTISNGICFVCTVVERVHRKVSKH